MRSKSRKVPEIQSIVISKLESSERKFYIRTETDKQCSLSERSCPLKKRKDSMQKNSQDNWKVGQNDYIIKLIKRKLVN
jgi:hypothetical protein